MHCSHVTALDERLAATMFWATVLFLTMCAGVLHLRNDVLTEPPRAIVTESEQIVAAEHDRDTVEVVPEACLLTVTARSVCVWGMLLLYPLFPLEAVLHRRAGGRLLRQHLWTCILPPLRLGVRDHCTGQLLWLPRIGWARTDEALLRRVERGAKWPMILTALLVLPLLAFEHFYRPQIQSSPWLSLFVQVSAALIWLAFAFEFVVMISIADRKWRYAREHWIDVLIILIPMFEGLRALRLGRLLRMQQVLRSLRLLRLRGTLLRAWRAVLLLEVVDRIVRRRPERRLQELRRLLAREERQLAELKQQIAQIEKELRSGDVLQSPVSAGVEEPAA
jgi:voltage-gated potassium channel